MAQRPGDPDYAAERADDAERLAREDDDAELAERLRPPFWWADPDVLVSVATHAVDVCEFTRPQSVVDFFEKPWHYPELYDLWAAEYRP